MILNISRIVCVVLAFSFLGCSSAQKQRLELRDKMSASSGLYCEFVSGDIHNDVDVEMNLQMAKRCDSSRPFSITNYKNSSENYGVIYCCSIARKEDKKVDSHSSIPGAHAGEELDSEEDKPAVKPPANIKPVDKVVDKPTDKPTDKPADKKSEASPAAKPATTSAAPPPAASKPAAATSSAPAAKPAAPASAATTSSGSSSSAPSSATAPSNPKPSTPPKANPKPVDINDADILGD